MLEDQTKLRLKILSLYVSLKCFCIVIPTDEDKKASGKNVRWLVLFSCFLVSNRPELTNESQGSPTFSYISSCNLLDGVEDIDFLFKMMP